MITMRKILLYFACKYQGDWEKIYLALQNREKIEENEILKLEEDLKFSYITIIDKDYPKRLKYSSKPPFVLFFKGNKKNLKKRMVNIIVSDNFLTIKNIASFKLQLDFKNISLILNQSEQITKKILNCIFYKNIVILKDNGIESLIYLSENLENEILAHNGLILSIYPKYTELNANRTKTTNELLFLLSDILCLNKKNDNLNTQNIINSYNRANKKIFYFHSDNNIIQNN